jgi:hypothetical protein
MCKEQWIEPKYCITKPTKVLKIDKNEEEKGGGRNNNWGLEGRGGGGAGHQEQDWKQEKSIIPHTVPAVRKWLQKMCSPRGASCIGIAQFC